MPEEGKVIPVRVALRCRPLVPKEVDEGCQTCLSFVPGEPQLLLGNSKSFTYDFVFSPDTPQEQVYEESVSGLITGIFKGYNATVLAYGQTGSGKTYSMGGGYGVSIDTDDSIAGIIPRVIRDLFSGIQERKDFNFTVNVSYLEIYREDLLDLLLPPEKRDKDTVTIREDTVGIKITGLTECPVTSVEDTMDCLERGSHGRTTGATAMNCSSSRSHAIFTLTVERTSQTDSQDYCKCKLHLVDLAGSERQKKTRAEGERLKEGININKGLLALGNVISALGDEAQRAKHVPYRDSKLTRLLQDSLGGNSHTVMIACVSPADSNMEETLSTLRYADRARKIKNKPVVNRDPQVAEILRLRQLVQDLQSQMVSSGKPLLKSSNSSLSLNESQDVSSLVNKNKELMEKNNNLERELEMAWEQNEQHCTRIIVLETRKDALQERLDRLKQRLTQMDSSDTENADIQKMVQGMIGDLMEQIDDIERTQNENFENYLESINNSHDASLSEEERQTTQVKQEAGKTKGDFDKLAEEMNQKFQERRAQMSRDLGELNKKLEMKQSRVDDMKLTGEMYDKMKEEYEENIKQLSSQVDILHSEKENLETQLQKNRATANASKVNETRRKRIQELETELSKKRKEITEANKMVKMKEQTVKDSEKLQKEIQAMKVQRVQLMKQMKADGEAFRKFKQQKDKEVLQLKAKDRKRQVMMTKLERQFTVQQGVLKRKNEESVALTKRLNEALLKQKKVLEERVRKEETQVQSTKGAGVKKYMTHEVEMMVDLQEAKDHKEELVKDRADINKEIKRLRDRLENGPPSKRKMLNDSSGKDTDQEKEKLRERLREMENHLAIKNSNINDISSKIMELEGDANEKMKRSRFQDIKTLVDARIGLNYLLQVASSAKVKCRKQDLDATNKDETVGELERQLQGVETELSNQKKEHDEEMEQLQRDHENKILFMLKQMQSKPPVVSSTSATSTDKEVQSRLKFQEQQINSLSHLKDSVEDKNSEIDNLRKELTRLTYNSRCMSTSLMPEFQDTKTGNKFIRPSIPCNENASFFSPVVLNTPVIERKAPIKRMPAHLIEEESEEDLTDLLLEESYESTDDNRDQEWHAGYTPGYGSHKTSAHLAQRKKEKRRGKESTSSYSETNQSTSSLSVPTTTTLTTPSTICSCIGTCTTKRCSCRKVDGVCDDRCNCRDDKCSNRGEQLTALNATFVKDASTLESSSECLKDTSNKRSLEEEEVTSEPRKVRRTGDENSLLPESDVSTAGIMATKQKKRKLGSKKGAAFFGPV